MLAVVPFFPLASNHEAKGALLLRSPVVSLHSRCMCGTVFWVARHVTHPRDMGEVYKSTWKTQMQNTACESTFSVERVYFALYNQSKVGEDHACTPSLIHPMLSAQRDKSQRLSLPRGKRGVRH